MTADKTASRRIVTRMVIGGAIGFVCGCLMGMMVSPPFSGITSTSSDVQGFTYLTWVGFGIMWGIVGLLVGLLLDFRKLKAEKNK